MFASIEWNGKMAFTGQDEEGHQVALDAPEAVGGEGRGMRPKEMMLNALAGCTAMDVISILNKMKVPPQRFRIEVEAQLADEHPVMFTAVHLRYIVAGEVPEQKLKRAIELSQERYCGVSAMFRTFADVSYEYQYEE